MIEILKQGDGNAHSKKDAPVRAQELRELASPALCKHLVEIIQSGSALNSNAATLLIACALKHASPASSVEPALRALAEEAAKPFIPGDDKEENLVEKPASHRMLKKIILHDKERAEGSPLFSLLLLEALDEDGLESWVTCNRGAFLFSVMMETELEEVKEAARDKLKAVAKTLQRQKTAGAENLRKLLGK